MRKFFLFLSYALLVATAMVAQERRALPRKLNSGATLLWQRALQGDTMGVAQVSLHMMPHANLQAFAQRYGVRFNVSCGDTHTALVPLRQFVALVEDTAVRKVTTSMVVKPMTDAVRRLTHATEVQSGAGLPMSYTGKGVLVGIIDMGFDFTHPNFRDADGRCRIVNVWDQNGTAGVPSAYGYGTVLDTPVAIATAQHDNSVMTHGTHVAGIAAGSAQNAYKGIAPEADLVLVSTNQSEEGIVDGVDYLLRYAEQVGKPIAINVSLGTMMGFKDGTGTMARMVDSLLANRPGALMAVAVGNEGHRTSTLSGADVKSVWKMPATGSDQLFLEVMPQQNATLQLTLRNSAQDTVFFDRTFTANAEYAETFGNFGTSDKDRARLLVTCTRNEVSHAYGISVHVGYSQQPGEEWEVRLVSADGSAKAYSNNGYFSAEGHEGFVDGTNASTIAQTACGRWPIAVGATVSKNSYTSFRGVTTTQPWTLDERYPLSALGPTSDQRIKPDIVAPGAAVVSSYNSFAAAYSVKGNDVVHQETVDGKAYYWYVESGTSMATPAVTGIMALWLQAAPQLTLSEARTIMTTTATHRPFMGNVPNNAYGAGQIDAHTGLLQLLSTLSVEQLTAEQTPAYVYDAATGTVVAQHATHLMLYSLNGRLLLSATGDRLSVSSLPRGLYLLRLQGVHGSQTAKLLR